MKRTYLLTLLLSVISLSWAQEEMPTYSDKQLDSVMTVIQESFELPGFAVGILKDDQVFYANGLGVQSLETQEPLTTQSLFHMASVSKPFVATAIMQLVEKGKVKLEDKLTDHLPYFKMKDKRYKKITIGQMLNHTSGIPDVEDYEWDKPQFDDGAAERFARSFTDSPLDFKPGKSFSYSNAAFDILAAVIAGASGMTFEEYMKLNIFQPLGMKNSTFYKPEVPEAIATAPHGMGDSLQMEVIEFYPYNRRHAPSSTLHSNVEDMFQWARCYFNGGELNGNRIFSPASYQALTTPTRKLNDIRSISLSWFTGDFDGRPYYYHAGGDDGYSTFFIVLPEEKSAVAIMGNNDNFNTFQAVLYLVDIFILHKPAKWTKGIAFDLKNIVLTEGVDSMKSFYIHAKNNMADAYDFKYNGLDEVGYGLLERGYHDKALEVFLFQVEMEPEHSGWPDSVGDAYMAMENEEKAIEWYEKALAINPKQGFTKEKLKEIRNK